MNGIDERAEIGQRFAFEMRGIGAEWRACAIPMWIIGEMRLPASLRKFPCVDGLIIHTRFDRFERNDVASELAKSLAKLAGECRLPDASAGPCDEVAVHVVHLSSWASRANASMANAMWRSV